MSFEIEVADGLRRAIVAGCWAAISSPMSERPIGPSAAANYRIEIGWT